jgi:Meckel syndrome type 1 protein
MSPPDEAEEDSTKLENSGWRAPLRGDFMSMPPFRLNTAAPARISARLAQFLVTRRSPMVSESDMRHGSTSERVGLIRFTNRRPVLRTNQETELVGRVNPTAADINESFAPDLPAEADLQNAPGVAPRVAPRAVPLTKSQPRLAPKGSHQITATHRIGPPRAPQQARSSSPRQSQLATSGTAELAEAKPLSREEISAVLDDRPSSDTSRTPDLRVRARPGSTPASKSLLVPQVETAGTTKVAVPTVDAPAPARLSAPNLRTRGLPAPLPAPLPASLPAPLPASLPAAPAALANTRQPDSTPTTSTPTTSTNTPVPLAATPAAPTPPREAPAAIVAATPAASTALAPNRTENRTAPKPDRQPTEAPLTPRTPPHEAPAAIVAATPAASTALAPDRTENRTAPKPMGTVDAATFVATASEPLPATGVQRRVAGTPTTQPPATPASIPASAPAITKDNIKSFGQPPGPTKQSVPADVRAAVSAVAGSSPPSVNLHRGNVVSKKAQALNADAYTHEGAVHIPGTTPLVSDDSRRLLAHELTHVVQQQQYGKNLPPEHTPLGRQLEASALHAETLVAPTPSPEPLESPELIGKHAKPATNPAMQPDLTPARNTGQSPRSSGLVAPEVRLNSEQPKPADIVLTPRRLPTVTATASTSQMLAGQPTWANQDMSGENRNLPGSTSQLRSTQPRQGVEAAAPEQVQRRARAQGDKQPTAAQEAATVKPRKEQAPRVEPPVAPQQTSFTSDARWLEQHANALYPLIRNMLRADLLKDRERRSKLMREY